MFLGYANKVYIRLAQKPISGRSHINYIMSWFVSNLNRPKPDQIENGDFDITALTSILTNCCDFADDRNWNKISKLLREVRNKMSHVQRQKVESSIAQKYIEDITLALDELNNNMVGIISSISYTEV